ncbi:MAG TPA: class I SAM-dependent methyltransferase [Candidatus Limnocylindrales bacterium]|nr:class I SAM-dependent methyltransferase [Candidatus Limnocylindrales bacterium]
MPLDTTFSRYADEHHLLRGMGEFLGDLNGVEVLEYGCGLGELTVVLARSGATVTSFDLSADSIEVARRRALRNDVADRITFVVANGEDLPFGDGRFDVAVGKAVLHHLEPTLAARELARVLRPGGRAAFSEPLGTNPFLVLARDRVPYPGKHERGADRPLTRADLAAWREPFERVSLRPLQLFSMIERLFGHHRRLGPLQALDRWLLTHEPRLWPWCRYAVLLFEASPSPSVEPAAEREEPATELAGASLSADANPVGA